MPNKLKTLTPEEEKKQLENAQQQASTTGYNSNWQGQIDNYIGRIQNREDFSYDVNADALYQQYANQYAQNGKLAMMDTMGRAQTMTGGYGNSYAQSAGQQAYQGYMNQLNDVVPELYDLALKKYMNEGDQMYNELAMMQQQDNIDYGRYQDQLAQQEDAYNKLVALMENYDYIPTAEEMAAAGMPESHMQAIMKDYLASLQGGGGGYDYYVDDGPNNTEDDADEAYRLYQQAVSQGYGSADLKTALKMAGYSDAVINDALNKYKEEVVSPLAKPIKTKHGTM